MDVAVLGAGRTGRGIAQLCAVAGHEVSLHGEDVDDVVAAIDGIEASLSESDDAQATARDRIDGTTTLDTAVAEADVVVAAEDGGTEETRALFAEIEELVDAETLIATSASTLSVTAVAAGLRQPARAVGLHFIDPPSAPLVEVVIADQTTRETRDDAVSFVDGLDCETIVVRDVPGFAATRLSLALSAEAMRMVEEEVAGVDAIDRAMEQGNDHPTGPLAAADMAGLDGRLDELEYLASALGPRFEPPAVLREKVAKGDLGRKSGEGFYVWEGGEPTEASDPDPTSDLREDTPTDPDGL